MLHEKPKHSQEEIALSLGVLKEYRKSIRQIGKRASLSSIAYPKEYIRVEYAEGATLEDIQKMTQNLFHCYFPNTTVHIRDVTFLENKQLTGGLRIFVGDDMIDITFDRFVPLLSKH